jgi:hypothetical protein
LSKHAPIFALALIASGCGAGSKTVEKSLIVVSERRADGGLLVIVTPSKSSGKGLQGNPSSGLRIYSTGQLNAERIIDEILNDMKKAQAKTGEEPKGEVKFLTDKRSRSLILHAENEVDFDRIERRIRRFIAPPAQGRPIG